MIGFLILIFFCYGILILFLRAGFQKVPLFHFKDQKPTTTFSIVIPFRNEAENIPLLLASIKQLKYPKELVEFLFVDDDSSDNSVVTLKEKIATISSTSLFNADNFKVLNNIRTSNSPKKDAIEIAIKSAKNEWIVTTDADCILPEKWLTIFDNYIQTHQPKMLVAPVNYQLKNTFLDYFQRFDFLSLQASTIGGFGIKKPFLCNGANLGYKKSSFIEQKGFKGNKHIASGDDIFFFEKMLQKNTHDVHYLKSKEAIVTTFPVATFAELIHQRTRWAAKTSLSKLLFSKFVGILVFSTNFLIALGTLSVVFEPVYLHYLLVIFIFKCGIDLIFIIKAIRFFNHKIHVTTYLLSSIYYPFFTTYIFFKTLFSSYKWKERSFKK